LLDKSKEAERPLSHWRNRFVRSAAVYAHSRSRVVCLGVAALVGPLVFLVWYPSPCGVAARGATLGLILVRADVILGISLTSVVESPDKPIKKLR
jgi:hypothetical protein